MIGITGSFGFLGQHIYKTFEFNNLKTTRILRIPDSGNKLYVPFLDTSEMRRALKECHTIVHAAAKNSSSENSSSDLVSFRVANALGTKELFNAALGSGLKRFIFVSSIKACSDTTMHGHILCPGMQYKIDDPYGLSKNEGEQELIKLSSLPGRKMETIIIRPTLIYGLGVKGNLQKLLGAVEKRRILPLGSIVWNRRSLLGLDNACGAILRAATSPFPKQQFIPDLPPNVRIYHLADEGMISTRRLIEVLAEGMDVKPRLIPMPRWLAMTAALPLGKGAAIRRLFGDLEVDSSDFNRDFDWEPEVALEDGLRSMARAWREQGGW